MKNANEKKVLSNEELVLVTGAGDENPTADDLTDQNKEQPEKKDKRPLPDGKIIM